MELKPKLKAALAKAEPAVQEFFKSPTGEFLKNNPKAVIGVLTVLAFIGIPGAGPLAALVKIAGPLNCDELQELNTLHPRQYIGLDLFTCPGRRASIHPLGAQRTRDPPVAMAPSPRRGPQRIFYFTTLNESSTSSTGGNPSLAGSALFQPGARRSSASYAPSFCVR